jgi:hypothetical protein
MMLIRLGYPLDHFAVSLRMTPHSTSLQTADALFPRDLPVSGSELPGSLFRTAASLEGALMESRN